MLSISQPPPTIVKRAMIKTGTYTGNDVDNRVIDIGIALSGKNNVYMIIKALNNEIACHRIGYSQGDLSMFFTNSGDLSNRIQAFTATGFQIGTEGSVNTGGVTYRYIVFWEEP